MKNTISIVLSLLLAVTLPARSADSLRFAALGQKLAEYYDAIEQESLAVQKAECDFLIESATDSLLRQFIAQDIYNHYIDSPVMGAENVAVHVFDRWFSDGSVAMSSPEAFADAKVYADFNRQSLIGCRAPSLEMERPDGGITNIFGSDMEGADRSDEVRTRKFSVLFFYDADCPKCRVQISLLNALFGKKDYPVDLYAVYVGDDRQKWEEIFAGDVTVHHFWDPAMTSDFQRKYGVTQTPRMFLVAPDGVILGRGLDATALETMLDGIFAPREMVYGGRESEELFDSIFAMSSGKPSEGDVKGIADYINDRTLAAGDTLMFRQMAGDYLYYLSSHSGEGFKEGMRYHIDRNILSQDGVWTSSDDTLKVVGFAQIMYDLLAKAAPGTKVPSLKVPGELYTLRRNIWGKIIGCEVVRRERSMSLDELKGDENIIIFYTEGCEVCDAEKQAAKSLLMASCNQCESDAATLLNRTDVRNIYVYMVNVDALMASNPPLASTLMDSFDLSSLPLIIRTDRRGTVLDRYISLLQ